MATKDQKSLPVKKVGLLLFYRIGTVLYALLQRRGLFHFAGGKVQTWPGMCQVTAEGKMEFGETDTDTLRREVCEELGEDFFKEISSFLPPEHVLFQNKGVTTYGLVVRPQIIRYITLESQSGGLVPIQDENLIKLLSSHGDQTYRDYMANHSHPMAFHEAFLAVEEGFRIWGDYKLNHRLLYPWGEPASSAGSAV